MVKILYTVLFIFFLVPNVYAQTSTFTPAGQLTTEEDGSPDLRCIKYKFPDDSVTDNADGTCSIAGGTGDITDVGDCATGACFTGASGTTLRSNTDLIMDLDDDNNGTESFQIRDGANTIVVEILESGLISTLVGIDGIGAVDFDIGSADILDVTIITDGGTVIIDGTITVGGNIVMVDNSVTGIDTLTFTDVNGTIAGIENQNLVDKTAAENISGIWEVQDDIDFRFGNGADWAINYDESVDNQLLFITAQTAATATTDPLVEFLVGTSPTANQQVFGVAKGTQASNTPLLTLDEDGDLVTNSSITSGGAVAGLLLGGETADPCATLGEGSIFYNTTGNFMCYCDGTNDLKMNDNSTACF